MENKIHVVSNIIYNDPAYGNIKKIFYVLKDIQFGIDLNRNWFQLKEDNENIILLKNELISDEINDSILSLLETSINNFKYSLEIALKNNNISTALADTFPYELIIFNGLHSESDWWVTLSLNWLMDLSIKKQYNYAPIITMIEKIKNNKAYSQGIRHKANKVLIKYREFS